MARWDLYDKTKYCTAKEAAAIYGVHKSTFLLKVKRCFETLRMVRTKTIMRGPAKIYLYKKKRIMDMFDPCLKPLKVSQKKSCVDVVPDGFISTKEVMELYNLSEKQVSIRVKNYSGKLESVYSLVKLGIPLINGHASTVARFYNHEQIKKAIDEYNHKHSKAVKA